MCFLWGQTLRNNGRKKGLSLNLCGGGQAKKRAVGETCRFMWYNMRFNRKVESMAKVKTSQYIMIASAALVAACTAVGASLIPAPREMKATEGFFVSDSPGDSVPLRSETDASLPKEGYRLSVTPDGISVRAADDAGVFYANMKQIKDPLFQKFSANKELNKANSFNKNISARTKGF